MRALLYELDARPILYPFLCLFFFSLDSNAVVVDLLSSCSNIEFFLVCFLSLVFLYQQSVQYSHVEDAL